VDVAARHSGHRVRPKTRDRCYDFKNIFAEKFSKKLAFFVQTTASFCKNVIITLVFQKNANFLAENWRKSPKIVIITSPPEDRGFSFSPDRVWHDQVGSRLVALVGTRRRIARPRGWRGRKRIESLKKIIMIIKQ
jgi:hypothetical protein